MELQLVNEWVKSAEGCFAAGDIASMRAGGRQMLEESPGNPVAAFSALSALMKPKSSWKMLSKICTFPVL